MKRAFQYTLAAWLRFFGGFGIEAGVDHYLRMRDGNVTSGGIPEPLWFGIHIFLGAVSAWLAWSATQSFYATWRRVAVVSVELAVMFFIYMARCLAYVIQTGIDTL